MQVHAENAPVRALWLSRDPSASHASIDSLARSGASVTRLSSTREVLELLDDSDDAPPHCLFVDPTVAGLSMLLQSLRSQPDFSLLPVIYVAQHVDDTVLAWARSLGADDIHWLADEDYLEQLVGALRGVDPARRPDQDNGLACFLHSHQERRRGLGRLFRNAGFGVAFADDENDLLRWMGRHSTPDILVASSAMLNGGVEKVEVLRAACGRPDLPCILIDDLDPETRSTMPAGGHRVAWMADDAPAEHALFLSNELLGQQHASMRKSPRLPHHGLCSFRVGRGFTYRFASLYNISRTGLYVRTLVPPPKGETVHVELALPGESIAHLAGVVAWSRNLGSHQHLAPTGFGMQLLASKSAPADLAAYVAAYESLAHSQGRSRSSGIRRPGVDVEPRVSTRSA